MTFVTQPFLPPLDELLPLLEQIWDSKALSNAGPMHKALEEQLAEYLQVPHVSLFCNATIALMAAQKVLDLSGEIITTPYSFVATSHAITWMNNTPVFVDIERDSLCLNPEKIAAAVTDKTVAIMPLHCYGNTCDTNKIAELANQYNLKVIYDACHSFGVQNAGESTVGYGDISVVSLHATKVFNTFEGGLLISSDAETKKRVDHLKNFGFVDEVTVVESGINGKMSEFNAAVGLVQLKYIDSIIQKRQSLDELYRDLLCSVNGIRCMTHVRQSQPNFGYFPIFVEPDYPIDRDALYEHLKTHDIHGRRYFYPLISEFPMYRPSAADRAASLPVAEQASRGVICLPLYPNLEEAEVRRICDVIRAVR